MKRMAKGAWIKFTATGEFRAPLEGESFIARDGAILCQDDASGWTDNNYDRRTILRRTESRGKK
jgi:hypothetical protein